MNDPRKFLLVILDRKEFEERLAAMIWRRPAGAQVHFLRSLGHMVYVVSPEALRACVADAVTNLSDVELATLVQAETMLAGVKIAGEVGAHV